MREREDYLALGEKLQADHYDFRIEQIIFDLRNPPSARSHLGDRRLGCETVEAYERRASIEQRERETEAANRRKTREARVRHYPITKADARAIAEQSLRITPSLSTVRAWRADKEAQSWLVLCGSVGRGKTLSACEMIAEHGGTYVGARDLERLSMAKFGDEHASYQKLADIGTLVIDDIGREDDVGRIQSALLDLLDWRRRDGMRTILIANFARKSFEQRYSDARLLSRLNECAQWFADVGEDMRRAK